jgi:hypothetical protein
MTVVPTPILGQAAGGVAGTCGWSAIVPSLDHIQGLTIKLQDSAMDITRI